MAANLKIGIVADDSGAQKKFEQLSTSIDYTSKTVTQLANQFAKLNEVNVKLSFDKTEKSAQALKAVQDSMTVTAKQLMNAIERQKISWGTNKDSVSALKKELSELEKVETLLIQKGVGSSMSRELEDLTLITDKYEEYKKELKEIIKLKEAEAVANAKKLTPEAVSNSAKGTTEYKKTALLGDDYASAKIELEAYNKALSEVIDTIGEGSPEAKALAERMNELETSMKSMEHTTTSTSVRIKNLIKNFVSAQMIVWAIRKAFNSVVSTLKESAEAASEAEETYNLFITTFENVAYTAENVATRLANSMGMANSTAQKALGTFGDLAAGYGATDKAALEFGETATEVALDIISYKNISGDLDTTFQSIASGLAGNVENFRKLGYVMTQAEVKTKLQQKGLDKLTGSSLQYAQIQARLEILQEKSYKAQGDMIKTLDSTENVTRRLSEAWLEYKENLGKSVNTVLTPLKKAWLGVLEQINKANEAQANFLKNGVGGGVYDVENNEKDRLSLQRQMQKEWGNYGTIGLIQESSYDTEIKKVISLMETFSTTPDVMREMFVENGFFSEGSETLEKIYEDLVEAHAEVVKKVEEQTKTEERNNKAITKIQSALTVMDSLSSINGVNVNTTPISTRLEATKGGAGDYMPGTLSGDVDTALVSMIKSLTEALPETFVSALDKALGNVDTEDMLEEKLSSVKSVYETLWNAFYSDTDYQDATGALKKQYQAMLDSLRDLAVDIQNDIDNTGEEAKYTPKKNTLAAWAYTYAGENLESAISAYSSYASNYSDEKNNFLNYSHITELEGYLEQIQNALNGNLTEKEFRNTLKEVSADLSESGKILGVDKLSSNPMSYISDLDRALGNDSLLDALNAQLDAYTDYYKQAKVYYMADGKISVEEQSSLDDILSAVYDIRMAKDNEEQSDTTEWGQGLDALSEEFSMFTNGIEGFVGGLLDLLVQTDLFQQSLTFISDTLLPVMNAFLEPISELLTLITESIQTLLCDALEPFYKLLLAIIEPIKNILSQLTSILSDFINTVMQPVLSIIESIIPLIVTGFGIIQSVLDILEPLLTVIGWIVNLLTPLVELVLKPIANTIKFIFELIITGMTYIEVFFKKVIGTVGKAFMDVWNSMVSVLRSINLLGWKPFENMSYADTSTMDTWKNLNYQEEINKKLDELNRTTNGIYSSNLSIKDNTSKDVDLSVLNEILSMGIISQQEYAALANKTQGLSVSEASTGIIKSESGNYASYLRSGSTTAVTYGDITIAINGGDATAEEIAKEVMKKINEQSRNGYKVQWSV